MADKLNFTSKSLLDVKFTKDVRGYNALEVDQTLDLVIDDLSFYEEYRKETSEYIRDLEKRIHTLNTKIGELEIELAKRDNRLSGIENNSDAKVENITLIKKIAALEKEVYRLGGDPSKIKV